MRCISWIRYMVADRVLSMAWCRQAPF
jgi:hypothetical protein